MARDPLGFSTRGNASWWLPLAKRSTGTGERSQSDIEEERNVSFKLDLYWYRLDFSKVFVPFAL